MKSPNPSTPEVSPGYENALIVVVCEKSVAWIAFPWDPLVVRNGKPNVLEPNGDTFAFSRSQAVPTAWLKTVEFVLWSIVGNPNEVLVKLA